ncbi:FAD binding domain-containing protein [Anaerostipes faecalis]|uniref:FAD binding domain-containing protein n=1 Tax=Anaerostipes faecalis TaxID=2738446 RepID=UPI001C1E5E52|nr:FAD binding domain-containing protein [Anaerostipes faecalis]
MLKIKEYVKAQSLEQAYELNQKKSTCILGGMLWLKMSNRTVQKAVDLSGLGLDQIEETEDEFSIGAMVTLRQIETHQGLNQWSHGAVKECVRSIVGVQFRNLATVGGSIFGRFGFSDVLTCFLAFDSYVELYHGGIISLQEFAQQKCDNDILVRLIVKKKPLSCVYLSYRNTKTDFPVLTCAISMEEEQCHVVLGARPGRAVKLSLPENWKDIMECDGLEKLAGKTAEETVYGSNMRAGADYRKRLAEVLIRRGLKQLLDERSGE